VYTQDNTHSLQELQLLLYHLAEDFSVVTSPEAMLVNEHTEYGATFLAAK
jgi:hypothetical protein